MTLPFFGFRMGSASGVFLQDKTVSDTVVSPASASTSLVLLNTGVLRTVTGGVTSNETDEWLLPNDAAAAAGFESRMTVLTGSFSSGTTATWENLGTTRTWTRTRGAIGTSSVTATLEIRNATSLQVLATAAISMDATVSP